MHRMTSGAGHDAMILAPHVPSAMLFLRSPGGISHHPDESVLPGDVDVALEAGRRLSMRSRLGMADLVIRGGRCYSAGAGCGRRCD